MCYSNIRFCVETVSAQSSLSSQSENEDQIFGTYRVLGNNGAIGYGLSQESRIDRNSVISEFIDEFGLYDEALNEHNNGFVQTSFSFEVDIKTNRLAAQAKSRYTPILIPDKK